MIKRSLEWLEARSVLNFHTKFNLIWTSMFIWKDTLKEYNSLPFRHSGRHVHVKMRSGISLLLVRSGFYVHPVWNELPAPTHFLVRTVESLLHQCSTVHRLHLCWLATNKKAFESWEAKSFLVALSKKFAGLERHRRCQLNQRGETKGAIWQQGTKSIDTACCVNL